MVEMRRCDYDIGYKVGLVCCNSKLIRDDRALSYPNYVYTVTVPCVPSKCAAGTVLSGCKRYSQGVCTKCTSAPSIGSYFSTPGTCSQALCKVAGPGYYYTSPCGEAADAVLNPCAKHPGNTEAPSLPASSLATAKFYCPNGAAVNVPDNAQPAVDYKTFVCNAGYYNTADRCLQCQAGTYCRGGVATQCPKHYYSAQVGPYANEQSYCKLCTLPADCRNKVICPKNIAGLFDKDQGDCGMVPKMCSCDGGCIQNSDCVTCGLCGEWPTTGLSCVLGDELDGMPAIYPPT